MIDEILRHNLIIREWVNGSLLPLNLSLVFVIGLFLWTEFGRSIDPFSLRDTWRRFQRRNGVQTACALFWIFLADAMRAGAAWSVLNARIAIASPVAAAIDYPAMPFIELVNAAFIVSGLIGLFGALRCIYLFTPERWGHWYWIGAVIVTALFQVVT